MFRQKIKKQIKLSDELLLNVNLSYLNCSLYTLFENNKIFKTFNLKTNILLDINNTDYFFYSDQNFPEFYKTLNKQSLRRFAYVLIKPLRKLDYYPFLSNSSDTKFKEENYKEINLLKAYLRKFKFHYRRHFFYQNWNYETLPAPKEMNSMAIKALFVLTGV